MWKVFMSGTIGLAILISLWASSPAAKAKITDVYRLKMVIQNPRVFDNMHSEGYRKYKRDVLYGELLLTYPVDGSEGAEIEVKNLYNKNYQIGGKCVTYDVMIDEEMIQTRINLMGNNRTGLFKKPTIVFSLVCDPSYNIGDTGEDNTLYIVVSGSGYVSTRKRWNKQVISTMHGFVAGTLGCGCSAYGHISPTRVNGVNGPILSQVDDVASVWGKWRAVYSHSIVR